MRRVFWTNIFIIIHENKCTKTYIVYITKKLRIKKGENSVQGKQKGITKAN